MDRKNFTGRLIRKNQWKLSRKQQTEWKSKRKRDHISSHGDAWPEIEREQRSRITEQEAVVGIARNRGVEYDLR